ncbi:MAG: LemA family protein, partial [Candidatus Micrarchaeota archaeon]|nr:LemA family protein [Candidatus Micrarchaeota archaeon]
MSKGDALGYGVVLAGIGVWTFYSGYRQYSLKKKIEYTPTSKAVSVAPGLTEVYGTAQPFKNTSPSPFGREQCVYYSTELGRSGLSKILFGEKEKDPNDPMHRFVAENAPNLLNYGDDLELEETFIRDEDKLYVLGTAKVFDPNETQPRMIIWDDPKGFFCISDYSEKETLGKVTYQSYLCALGGPLLFLSGCALTIGYLFKSFSGLAGVAMAAAAVIAFAMYLSLLWIWLLEFYNGLVLLKNQVGRARANIDTFLIKRHELIPNLVKVVEEYAKYEKGLQVSLAEIRSAKVGGSEKNLIAISEAYPKLKANENFTLLQKELVK